LAGGEELLHHVQIRRAAVRGQALYERPAVLFLEDAVVEQGEQAAVVERADQAAKALFQSNDGGGDLVVEEGVAAVFVDGFDAGSDYRITRHGEGQAVDDHAAELLALHVNALPEGRGGEEHGVRGDAELLKQRGLWGIPLQEHGEVEDAEKAMVDVVHLRV